MTQADEAMGNEYSLDMLTAATGAEGELAVQVASTFLRVGPDLRERLHAAVAGADANGVVAAAHELKGMAAMIGAERLSLAAKALEMAGRNGEREFYSDPAPLARIEDEWVCVADTLKALTPPG